MDIEQTNYTYILATYLETNYKINKKKTSLNGLILFVKEYYCEAGPFLVTCLKVPHFILQNKYCLHRILHIIH